MLAPASAKDRASSSTGLTMRCTSMGALDAVAAQRPANHRANGQVGHVVVIHDVEVDHVGAGLQHGFDFLAQAGEIGRQDGGGDPGALHIGSPYDQM